MLYSSSDLTVVYIFAIYVMFNMRLIQRISSFSFNIIIVQMKFRVR